MEIIIAVIILCVACGTFSSVMAEVKGWSSGDWSFAGIYVNMKWSTSPNKNGKNKFFD